ncbi:MAG: hypothetical protein ACRDSH_09710 [Pseudonocardiaceae bacterium]
MTEPNPGSCPYCDVVGSVRRVACKYPTLGAWSCAACGGEWWTSVVNPVNAFLRQLAEDVAARSLLRRVQALAEQAPGLSDGQVKARALSLLAELDQHARTWPG